MLDSFAFIDTKKIVDPIKTQTTKPKNDFGNTESEFWLHLDQRISDVDTIIGSSEFKLWLNNQSPRVKQAAVQIEKPDEAYIVLEYFVNEYPKFNEAFAPPKKESRFKHLLEQDFPEAPSSVDKQEETSSWPSITPELGEQIERETRLEIIKYLLHPIVVIIGIVFWSKCKAGRKPQDKEASPEEK